MITDHRPGGPWARVQLVPPPAPLSMPRRRLTYRERVLLSVALVLALARGGGVRA